MNEQWVKLSDRLPEGKEWVLLFNEISHTQEDFPGLSVTTSNPVYVRNGNAFKNGYTHWARIPYPLPMPGGYTEDEK